MITPAEIADYGQRHVEAYLTSTGYHCHTTKTVHGGTDIDARGEEESLFVHVMSALAPHEVPEPTTSEVGRVVSRAMTLGYDAWLAKVQVTSDGDLASDIQWSQLNH